jgi:tripartite-type tricarboxylate transporter receptor subunit TctC
LRILAIADLERHAFLPEVKTFKELGIDVDDSSVNYRGVLLPKGAPKEVIAKCGDMFVKMFNDPQTLEKMKASGSPVKIMDRDAVIKMFQERENYLKGLLVDLKKNKQ